MSRDTTHNSLRSRKLDYRRQIPVFKHYEVPDLDESASINRSIVQVATGVEKEEEEVRNVILDLHLPLAGGVAWIIY